MPSLSCIIFGAVLAYFFKLLIAHRFHDMKVAFFFLMLPACFFSWITVILNWRSGGHKFNSQKYFDISTAFNEHLAYTMLGAVCVGIWAFFSEGWHVDVMEKLQILSGRGRPNRTGPSLGHSHQKMPSTLMGSSTAYFAVENLDVKTTALIKFALFAFNKNNATLVSMERFLKLGDGRRRQAFQSLAASMPARPKLRNLVKPYLYAINGNHASARLMFRNLCEMAKYTGNTDSKTIDRLSMIGKSLNLSPQDMGQSILAMR